ncbi:actin-like ATPase domain-containing protein [Venturia nashicola]|uniref:Actin-like ATPase domain-containing protein n=1 Tax=Venturia nashicola TaxID=86259 RepID=A0A4Z1PGQ9_9PEZI|nr:actin-like ATPase domain-containing protein [Venturia nashicola]
MEVDTRGTFPGRSPAPVPSWTPRSESTDPAQSATLLSSSQSVPLLASWVPQSPPPSSRSPASIPPIPRSIPPPPWIASPQISHAYRSSPRPAGPAHTRPPFLIGIDFGTTFSGVAWAKSSGRSGSIDPQNINVVTDWPAGDNRAKVPTRIHYTAGGGYQCGYEIPNGADPLKWFKLLLMKNEDIPQYIRDSGHINKFKEALARLEKEGKDVVQVIADYLRFLWNNTIAAIEKSETRAVVDSTPYVVVLTFPALWETEATQRMQDAARQAGILDPRRRTTVAATTLHTVEEPEAAALATYADLRENHAAFSVGQSFVVVDAGGGTCDVVTYEVLENNPLQLKEWVRGDGRLCGAVFLDEEFDRKLRGWVGRQKVAAIGEVAYRKLLDDNWERSLKKDFDGTDRDWSFPTPPAWEKKKGFREKLRLKKNSNHGNISELHLTHEKLQQVYKPIVGQIYELTLLQVSTAAKKGKIPNAILLAGGLGGNKYLYKFLAEKFPRIEIVQRPYPKPWSAICRGAVIRADIVTAPPPDIDADLTEAAGSPQVGVISRKSRHSYGIVKFEDFIPGFHDLDDRYEMNPLDRVVARNQMEWYIKRNDDILDRQGTKMDWKRYLPEHCPDPVIGVDIWQCDQTRTPPRRKESYVRKLCTINARLPALSELPVMTNAHGQASHVVHFDLQMTPIGTSLEWTVWINGVKQGEERTNIAYG